MRMQLGIKRLLLISLSTVITFAVLELGFRAYTVHTGIDMRIYLRELTNTGRLPKGMIIADPVRRVRLEPNFEELAVTADFQELYTINAQGLRDTQHPYQKSAQTRVLALGDSFTFGEGVAYGDRFTEVIETRTGVEVINAGVPGFGLDLEYLYLVHEGLTYQPDVVLIFLNWFDIRRYITQIVQADTIVLDSTVSAHPVPSVYVERQDLAQLTDTWYASSQLLNYLSYQVVLWSLQPKLAKSSHQFWQETKTEMDVSTLTTVDREYYVDKATVLLRGFTRLATQHHFDLVVVNIDTHPIDFIPQEYPNLTYWDLSPQLAQLARKQSLTFTYDQHYNPQTHHQIGEWVSTMLLDSCDRLDMRCK